MADAGGTSVEWLDSPSSADVTFESRWRRRWPLGRRATAAVVAVVTVAAVVVGWGVTRPPVVHITVAGVAVRHPGDVLARADREFHAYAAAHRGALASGSRCFFDRPPGAHRNDVVLTLQCGPVAFFGNPRGQDYLAYPLTSTPPSHGAVTLTVSAAPLVPTPAAPPAGTLLRTDRRRPVADHLVAPLPPPGPPNLLADLGPGQLTGLASLPPTARLGSYGTVLSLLSSGPVLAYGAHDAARSAPPGDKLIGFALVIDSSDYDETTPDEVDLELSVDGAPGRRLPVANLSPGVIQDYIAAVPLVARSLELVLIDHGVRQELSLLTGASGPGTITVYQRATRQVGITAQNVVSGHLDGRAVTVQLAATTASLEYYGSDPRVHPASIDDAYLRVDLCAAVVEITPVNECSAPQATDMRLQVTGAGSQAITPAQAHGERSLAVDDGVPAWEVPADFTAGVITLTTYTLPGGPTVTLDRPFSLPVQIPLD